MGFRVFVLCLQQLRNNWQTALRISWFWWLLLTAGGFAMRSFAQRPDDANAGSVALIVLVTALVALIGGTIIAIAWHRFVLREDTFGNMLIFQNGWPVGTYIWALIRLALILFVLLVPLVFVFALNPGLMASGPSLLISVAMGIVFTWVFLRVGLVFPAIAVGKTLKIRESFQMTRPFATELLITSGLLVAIQTFPGILQLLAVAAGAESLSVILIPINLLFSWVNLFLGIGVLTVMYGHLCENRPI